MNLNVYENYFIDLPTKTSIKLNVYLKINNKLCKNYNCKNLNVAKFYVKI